MRTAAALKNGRQAFYRPFENAVAHSLLFRFFYAVVLSRKPTSRNTNARFKQAVQSPPCLFGALCSALRRKTFFRRFFELLSCLTASKYVTAHAPAARGGLSQTICQYPSVGARRSLRTLRGVEAVILLNIARFKQAVQSPPCLSWALCSALRRKTFFRRFFELLSCLAAACRRCLIPRERCPLCLIPRTGVIALHSLVARPTAMSF